MKIELSCQTVIAESKEEEKEDLNMKMELDNHKTVRTPENEQPEDSTKLNSSTKEEPQELMKVKIYPVKSLIARSFNTTSNQGKADILFD